MAAKKDATILREEQIFCYEHKVNGDSLRTIADKFEAHFGYRISYETVSKRIKSELEARPVPHVEEVRKQSIDRLDYLSSKLKLDDGDPAAIATALRIDESRRKLLGVDAIVKQEIAVLHIDATNSILGPLLQRQRELNSGAQLAIEQTFEPPEEQEVYIIELESGDE